MTQGPRPPLTETLVGVSFLPKITPSDSGPPVLEHGRSISANEEACLSVGVSEVAWTEGVEQAGWLSLGPYNREGVLQGSSES